MLIINIRYFLCFSRPGLSALCCLFIVLLDLIYQHCAVLGLVCQQCAVHFAILGLVYKHCAAYCAGLGQVCQHCVFYLAVFVWFVNTVLLIFLFKVWFINTVLFIVLFFFTSPAYLINLLETLPFLNDKSIR